MRNITKYQEDRGGLFDRGHYSGIIEGCEQRFNEPKRCRHPEQSTGNNPRTTKTAMIRPQTKPPACLWLIVADVGVYDCVIYAWGRLEDDEACNGKDYQQPVHMRL